MAIRVHVQDVGTVAGYRYVVERVLSRTGELFGYQLVRHGPGGLESMVTGLLPSANHALRVGYPIVNQLREVIS